MGLDPIDLRLKNITTFSQVRGVPYTSTGLAACVTEGGMWQGGNGGPPATVIVKLFSDGSAHLNMGASDIGCGTKTWAAQIVSEELRIPLDRISIEHADTATTQFATPSGGSKTVPTESPAIRAAAWEVRRQLLAMAAEHLKAPQSELDLHGPEVVSTTDPTKKVAIAQIPAFSRRGLLVGVGYRGPTHRRRSRQRARTESPDVPQPGIRWRDDGNWIRVDPGTGDGHRPRQAALG